MSRVELLERKIEDMENKGYGCMFADFGREKMFPYEMFTGLVWFGNCSQLLVLPRITSSAIRNRQSLQIKSLFVVLIIARCSLSSFLLSASLILIRNPSNLRIQP